MSGRPRHPDGTRADRFHAKDRPADQRTNFERDRDRILYSSAFRRLAGVTQVVHAAEGHVFHNRLTHTLKVAQVGRRIAEYLINHEPPELMEAVGGIDPSVVETAALAHDLGHPPFGHIAEEELDHALRTRDIPDGYEGNAQSFRIVTKVAIKSTDFPGLNLTRATLNAILKYPWGRGVEGKEHRKWGYYHSETEEFRFARLLTSPSDRRQRAEAALMDWADDIAYSVHDVDDFYRAGLIPLDRLLANEDERDRFIEAVFARWQDEDQVKLKTITKEEAIRFFQLLSVYGDRLRVSFVGNRDQRAALNFLSSSLIGRYIIGAGEEDRAITLVDSAKEPYVKINPKLRGEVDLLKELMRFHVFDNAALLAQQHGQRRVIRELFEVFYDAVQPSSKFGGLIPPPYADLLHDIKHNEKTRRARLVADLIAGLTEQQALLLHQRLMGLTPGSVRDHIVH